jgi:hypothetical protein
MYLQSVGLSPNYRMLQPRRPTPYVILCLFDPEFINETNFVTRLVKGVTIMSCVGGVCVCV